MIKGNHRQNGSEGSAVLVVNDLPEQLQLMNTALGKAGYTVLTAENGLRALEVARTEPLDLIISDVTMPQMNGIEFCREVRRDEKINTLPILLVSALRTDTD